MKRELLKLLGIVGLLAFAFVLVWMNRYQYQQAGTRLVRINRFTAQGCYFQGDGTWDSRATPPAKSDVFAKYGGHAISPDEVKKEKDAEVLFGRENGSRNTCQ